MDTFSQSSPASPPEPSSSVPGAGGGGLSLEQKRAFMQQQREAFTLEQKRAFMQQQRAQYQQQQQPPVIEATVEGDNGIMDYVKDMAFGLSAGTNKAVNEVMDLSWGVSNFAKTAWDKGISNAEFREPTPEEQGGMWRLPVVQEAETLPGKLVQGAAQFVTGFVATGTAMKAAKVLQGTRAATQVVRPMVQGAVADFATFDAHEERLSNLVEDYPELASPITAYLAADDKDSMLEGRFKNALEGLGLGMAADSLLQGLKMLKDVRKARNADEALAAIDEHTAVPSPEVPRETPDAGGVKPEAPDPQPGNVANAPQTGDKGPVSSPVEARNPDDPAVTPEAAPKAPENPLSTSTPATTTAPVELATAEQMKALVDKAADATEAIREVTYNINLNRMVFESPQGSHVIKGMADALADKTLKAAGTESHARLFAETKAELEAFGLNYNEAVAEVGNNPQALAALNRRMLVNRNILHLMTTELSRLSQKLNGGRASIVEQAQFAMLSKNIQEMHIQAADMRTEVGRALSAMKMEVNDDTARAMLGDDFLNTWSSTKDMTTEDATTWLSRNGWKPDDLQQLARDMTLAGDRAANVGRIARKAQPGATWWGIANEVRTNGFLAGPKTLAINGLSSAIKVMTMPVEKMLGAAMTGDTRTLAKAAQTYVGMYKFFGDAWSMAGKAWKVGENRLDRRNGIMETPSHQISFENIKRMILKNRPEGATLAPFEETMAYAMSWLGTAIRLPTRVLLSTDEFFKQLTFRSDLYAKLYMEATEKGMKNADQIADYIETTMRQAFDDNGAVVRGELTADSLLTAQRATWTQNLGADTFGGSLQTLANKQPVVRFILPFIKTPTNIFRDFIAHTPGLAGFTREYKEAIKVGGEEAARVRGQVAMGTFTILTGYSLAANGLITGSPPKNPKLRRAWEATGWEPYSLKIGDSYLSYRRMDPVGMFLGACADIVAIRAGEDDLSELTEEQLVGGLFGMVFNNLTSKTYMQGLTEVINVVNDGERYGTSFAGRALSTFIPYSSLAREVRKHNDPSMREMESVLDYARNTVPGLSADLPVKHQWVTGQMMDYRPWVGHDNNNPVLDEMVTLGRSVTGAPPKQLEGVGLNAAQYSRLCELHGTVKIGGKTMQQALERLINSPGYDKNRDQHPDALEGMPNPRATKVNKIIDRYRKQAARELKREDAELQHAVLEEEIRRKASKRGFMNKHNEQDMLNRFLNNTHV